MDLEVELVLRLLTARKPRFRISWPLDCMDGVCFPRGFTFPNALVNVFNRGRHTKHPAPSRNQLIWHISHN